jgi:uncharacterized RDD family membrane protein YckC
MAEQAAARPLATSAAANRAGAAPFGTRLLAYLLDSVVLFGFTMLFASVAFINIFLRSESGRTRASDEVIWDSVILLVLTVPAWLLVSLLLTWRRGQTVGQYVAGLRLAREDGADPGIGQLALYWLALHPLLFHPLLGGFWLLMAVVALSLQQHDAVLVLSLGIAILCLLAPIASLVFAMLDPERRAIHDRIAGIRVVRLE